MEGNTTQRPISVSEMITVLAGCGVRVHRGMPYNDLHRVYTSLLQGNIVDAHNNPMDALRNDVIDFTKKHPEVLIQLSCDGDCYQHPDAQVALCANKLNLGG